MRPAATSARCTSPGTETSIQPSPGRFIDAAPASTPSPGAKSQNRAVSNSDSTPPAAAATAAVGVLKATLLHSSGGQASDDVALHGQECDHDREADDNRGGHELVP